MAPHIVRPASNGVVPSGGPGAKLVLTDALMKRGAAIRAARGEPEDDGLPEGEAEDATTDTTTPSEDNA
jgi:ribosome maturation factor RimP